jgi:hypothetical protein
MRIEAAAEGESAKLHEGASYRITASLNKDYEAHLKECEECRQTIVTDLLEFAYQVETMR